MLVELRGYSVSVRSIHGIREGIRHDFVLETISVWSRYIWGATDGIDVVSLHLGATDGIGVVSVPTSAGLWTVTVALWWWRGAPHLTLALQMPPPLGESRREVLPTLRPLTARRPIEHAILFLFLSRCRLPPSITYRTQRLPFQPFFPSSVACLYRTISP